MRVFSLLGVFFALNFAFGAAVADVCTVAVAANFTAPMQKIAALFEQKTGHQLRIAYGSTGKFYAQIQQGAPFEVLLAADSDTPQRLEGHEGVAGTRFTYAIGQLVLWSPDPQRVDNQGLVLQRGQFQHLALAQPQLAPYGLAAVHTLQHMGLYARLQPKLVLGDNISQTQQFVASGNAELGFVALSQVYQQGRWLPGSVWRVPAAWHQPLRQDALLLQAGRHRPAARALLQFLRQPEVQSLLRSYGYEVPAA